MPKECVNIIHIVLIHRVKWLIFGIKLKGFYSERRIESLNGMPKKI